MVTLRPMKLLFWVAVLTAVFPACSSSSSSTAPDAALVQPVHDMLLSGCDQGWSTAAGSATVAACASACVQMPDCTPNGKKFGRPCDDLPACSAARDHDSANNPVGPAISCGATFIANDATGGHLGCCVLDTVSAATAAAHFYECTGG